MVKRYLKFYFTSSIYQNIDLPRNKIFKKIKNKIAE